MEIRLSIKDKYFDAFMSIVSKLNYVKIHEIIDKKNIETKADGWKQVAQDDEMLSLANEGLIIEQYFEKGFSKQNDREEWKLLTARGLNNAYSDDEPDYSLD